MPVYFIMDLIDNFSTKRGIYCYACVTRERRREHGGFNPSAQLKIRGGEAKCRRHNTVSKAILVLPGTGT